MTCVVPSQELSNGMCFDRCKPGWSPYGGLCLQECPEGFKDRGHACEPPSALRTVSRPYLSACPDGQIDRNGACYEPQTVSYIFVSGPNGTTTKVPKVSGCGCIRRTLEQRLQCPGGFEVVNGSCASKCPPGFGASEGLYCSQECPLKKNSKERWASMGGLCVKDHYSRVPHDSSAYTSTQPAVVNGGGTLTRTTQAASAPVYGLPFTVVSYLASRPQGSSLQDRIRAGQTIAQSLGASGFNNPFSNAVGDSWLNLLLDPSKILLFAAILVGVIWGGPYLFGGVGALFKGLAGGTGEGIGAAVKGTGQAVGSVVRGAGRVAESAENVVADISQSVGENVAASVAMPAAKLRAREAAAPLEAQTVALGQLTSAQAAYNTVSGAAPGL